MGGIEVVYDERRWRVLRRKREIAKEIARALAACGFRDFVVHGSVARGDVDEDSDVDVAVLSPAPVGLVELCLERAGLRVFSRVLVQPTPVHSPKVYLYLDPFEERVVSLPLVELEPIEKEFYRFSGSLALDQLLRDERVPGVDKRLMLIVPTPRGHVEAPVVGNEGVVARFLGVSIQVVLDRVRALTRRAEEGHTGLFIEIEVPPQRSVEEVVRELCRENRLFRQRVARHGLC
ncbi:MAG: DNA polymerase subunit beta [Crenarchaeota archaeon]|nr:DNA polymerase subunit beta [Thermoproteota archaeon]